MTETVKPVPDEPDAIPVNPAERPAAAARTTATGPSERESETAARCEPGLLSLLVCPYSRTSLGYDAARQELVSRPERIAFPIRDGNPILVREEARSLELA
jgi:uncharacterized protein